MQASTHIPPGSCLGSHQALRAATAASHTRLDALFGGFDLGVRDEYCRFLLAHAAAALSLEAALDAGGMHALLPDWPQRQRASALRADLDALGVTSPPALPASPLHGDGALWGAAYVLEGSRLGGAVLARRLAAGLPRRYLAASALPAAWPQFLKQMDAALQTPSQLAAAVAAALSAFERFEHAGQQQLQEPLA